MATINNVYVLVESENIGRSSNVPQHPVETGLPITDNVRKNPKSLSISGKIVDTSSLTTKEIISKLESFKDNGSLIKYNGLNNLGNYLITSFNTTEDHTTWGGANFDMELLEVRIVKSAYDPSKQKTENSTNALVLEVGATVIFKGGPVYVASDSTVAAATRGRSTCKITIINNRSWSIHDYHLISTDGGKVYGWVDVENIEGYATKKTSSASNGGTQQTKNKTTTPTSSTPLGQKNADARDARLDTCKKSATAQHTWVTNGVMYVNGKKYTYQKCKWCNETRQLG